MTSMTRQQRYRARLRVQVDQLMPSACHQCGEDTEPLELAHVADTPMTGTGGSRGSVAEHLYVRAG